MKRKEEKTGIERYLLYMREREREKHIGILKEPEYEMAERENTYQISGIVH